MGEMPVIRPLPSLLGEIGPCPLRAQEVGLVGYIVASPCNALRPMVPVYGADELGMAEGAAVRDIDLPSLLLEGGPRPVYVGRLVGDRRPRQDDRDEEDRAEDDESPYNNQPRRHSHASSSGLLVREL